MHRSAEHDRPRRCLLSKTLLLSRSRPASSFLCMAPMEGIGRFNPVLCYKWMSCLRTKLTICDLCLVATITLITDCLCNSARIKSVEM
jgi:hypothetical protein